MVDALRILSSTNPESRTFFNVLRWSGRSCARSMNARRGAWSLARIPPMREEEFADWMVGNARRSVPQTNLIRCQWINRRASSPVYGKGSNGEQKFPSLGILSKLTEVLKIAVV